MTSPIESTWNLSKLWVITKDEDLAYCSPWGRKELHTTYSSQTTAVVSSMRVAGFFTYLPALGIVLVVVFWVLTIRVGVKLCLLCNIEANNGAGNDALGFSLN